jgi:hypothetical protein
MLPPDMDIGEEARRFFEEHLAREYSQLTLLLALPGIPLALLRRTRKALLLLLSLLFAFLAGLLYDPGDKFIFYLPAYLLLAVLSGIGADGLARVAGRLRIARPVPKIESALLLALLLLCIAPFAPSRWQAMRSGASYFIGERKYPYPYQNLAEPRLLAACVLDQVKPDALLLLDWRQLWSTAYLAYAEGLRPDIQVWEAFPYGTDGLNASMYESIEAAFDRGLPVYSNRNDSQHFNGTYRMSVAGSVCAGRFMIYELQRQPQAATLHFGQIW